MVTHWMVDSGEWKSRLRVSMATLTIVVSRMDMTAPSTTTTERRRITGSCQGLSLTDGRAGADSLMAGRLRRYLR